MAEPEDINLNNPDQITDPTWQRALKVTRSILYVPTQLWSFIRNSWADQQPDPRYLTNLAQTSVGAGFLFDAAKCEVLGNGTSIVSAEQAIETLGYKRCAAILAVNYSCRRALRLKPAATWQKIFREMMTTIEIGARLGNRASNIGVEVGILAGFAKYAALSYLLVSFPDKFKKWWIATGAKGGQKQELEAFGCESYQVAAFILQQLGFGTATAMGIALGIGNVDPQKHLSIGEQIQKWRSVYLWIDALKSGRSYPGPLDAREYFPELKLPFSGKNTILEVLYTEVGHLQRDGSSWTWHLPRSTYEEAERYMIELKSKPVEGRDNSEDEE